MAPIILVTSRVVKDDPNSTPLVGARRSYLDAIVSAGADLFIAPALDNRALMRKLVAMADGVLLPGGEDVDPARYNTPPSPLLGTVDRARDASEFEIVAAARERGLPILGICRGCQLINVAFGGTLYQDINSERAHLPAHSSKDASDFYHNIKLVQNSCLMDIIESSELRVNSIHHQAVKQLGQGLVANAHDEHGLIEGVEGVGSQFVLGIQCHPELLLEEQASPWKRLFRRFVEVCSAP